MFCFTLSNDFYLPIASSLFSVISPLICLHSISYFISSLSCLYYLILVVFIFSSSHTLSPFALIALSSFLKVALFFLLSPTPLAFFCLLPLLLLFSQSYGFSCFHLLTSFPQASSILSSPLPCVFVSLSLFISSSCPLSTSFSYFIFFPSCLPSSSGSFIFCYHFPTFLYLSFPPYFFHISSPVLSSPSRLSLFYFHLLTFMFFALSTIQNIIIFNVSIVSITNILTGRGRGGAWIGFHCIKILPIFHYYFHH
jgi:hypothetical protein